MYYVVILNSSENIGHFGNPDYLSPRTPRGVEIAATESSVREQDSLKKYFIKTSNSVYLLVYWVSSDVNHTRHTKVCAAKTGLTQALHLAKNSDMGNGACRLSASAPDPPSAAAPTINAPIEMLRKTPSRYSANFTCNH